jgi:hypothetical protein
VEVRSLVSAMEGKARSCRASLDAQNVHNALYGLQCMSSDHEVQSALEEKKDSDLDWSV